MKQDDNSHNDTVGIRMRYDKGSTEVRVPFQAEANKEGGAYNVGPDFVSFVSVATSSAHVDGVRFVMAAGVEGVEDGREEGLSRP